MEQKEAIKLIGLMLYAGEGAKTGRTVDFTNANPVYIQAFLRYLRECCQIRENRVKLYLYCFENQSVYKLISFWSKTLNVKPEQFTKPYIKKVTRPGNRICEYGIIHIRYSDKKLLLRILSDIDDTLKIWVGTQVVNGG